MTGYSDESERGEEEKTKNGYNNVQESFTFNVEGYILDYNGCGYNLII